ARGLLPRSHTSRGFGSRYPFDREASTGSVQENDHVRSEGDRVELHVREELRGRDRAGYPACDEDDPPRPLRMGQGNAGHGRERQGGALPGQPAGDVRARRVTPVPTGSEAHGGERASRSSSKDPPRSTLRASLAAEAAIGVQPRSASRARTAAPSDCRTPKNPSHGSAIRRTRSGTERT